MTVENGLRVPDARYGMEGTQSCELGTRGGVK